MRRPGGTVRKIVRYKDDTGSGRGVNAMFLVTFVTSNYVHATGPIVISACNRSTGVSRINKNFLEPIAGDTPWRPAASGSRLL